MVGLLYLALDPVRERSNFDNGLLGVYFSTQTKGDCVSGVAHISAEAESSAAI
jgi:hypothetical protein